MIITDITPMDETSSWLICLVGDLATMLASKDIALPGTNVCMSIESGGTAIQVLLTAARSRSWCSLRQPAAGMTRRAQGLETQKGFRPEFGGWDGTHEIPELL